MMSYKRKKRLPLIMPLLNRDSYSDLVRQFQTKLASRNSEAGVRLVIKNFFSLSECSSGSVHYLIYSAFSC